MKTVLTDGAGHRVLVVRRDGAEVGQRVDVYHHPFFIGRGSQADLDLDTDRASRKHARIDQTAAGAWTITDLGSANGTRLQGELLRGPATLSSGDVIEIGRVELEWRVLRDGGLTSSTETAIVDPE